MAYRGAERISPSRINACVDSLAFRMASDARAIGSVKGNVLPQSAEA